MACPFDITVATNSVRLNAKRQGEAAFTAYNRSGRPVRGRAQIAPQNPAAAPWLELVGDVERSFAIAGTEQYTVQLAVLDKAPPGNYSFRLDMVGVENPDEDYCSGPSVTFEVPQPVPIKPFPWWIVIAAVVALLVIGGAAYFLWPRSVQIPALQGLAVNDAKATLAASNLAEGNLLEGDGGGTVEPGKVVASTPEAGQSVDRNSPVDLVVAMALTDTPTPEPTSTPVPSPTPTLDLAATATVQAQGTATAIAQAIDKYTGSWEVIEQGSPYITKLAVGRTDQTITLAVSGLVYPISNNGNVGSAICPVLTSSECTWGNASGAYSGDPLKFAINPEGELVQRITLTSVDASTLSAVYQMEAGSTTLPSMSFLFKRVRFVRPVIDDIIGEWANEAVIEGVYLTPMPIETLTVPDLDLEILPFFVLPDN